MVGYDDLKDHGNSPKHHTGKECIEPGCNEPAGTLWSPHWCFKHNVERIDKINQQMKRLQEDVTKEGE